MWPNPRSAGRGRQAPASPAAAGALVGEADASRGRALEAGAAAEEYRAGFGGGGGRAEEGAEGALSLAETMPFYAPPKLRGRGGKNSNPDHPLRFATTGTGCGTNAHRRHSPRGRGRHELGRDRRAGDCDAELQGDHTQPLPCVWSFRAHL